jgi:DNA-binding LacI/PurR family transcriptional regulator
MPPDPAGSARPARRPTIADIARAAGVSKSAVSYALDGQQGIGLPARTTPHAPAVAARSERAARFGRQPSSFAAARIRSAVAVAPFGPYFSDLFSGIEGELSSRGIALTLQMVDDTAEEMVVLRKRHRLSAGRVDN